MVQPTSTQRPQFLAGFCFTKSPPYLAAYIYWYVDVLLSQYVHSVNIYATDYNPNNFMDLIVCVVNICCHIVILHSVISETSQ